MTDTNTPLPQSRQELISALKHYAKSLKQAQPSAPLSVRQNIVAATLGYSNWSLLHKHVRKMSEAQFAALHSNVSTHPELGAFLKPSEPKEQLDEEAAKEEMRNWVRSNFTPLIEFAFYDSEAENGFAWPDVELNMELQSEFDDQYPLKLIEEVASELEEEGPWGEEDYGDVDSSEGEDDEADQPTGWN